MGNVAPEGGGRNSQENFTSFGDSKHNFSCPSAGGSENCLADSVNSLEIPNNPGESFSFRFGGDSESP